MHNKTWLVSIALASSFFGIFTQTSYAFTNLDAGANGQNTTNPAYDDASTGYNFTAPNVDFTIIGGSTTPFVVSTDAGRSIDNTANNAGDNLFTTGLVQFNGTIGASNAIAGLNVMGGVATLFGDVLNQTPINLYSSTIQVLDNVNLTGPVDSLSSTYFPSGTIVFINLFSGAATSTLSGNIGATNPLAYIVTVPIAGTQQVIFQTNTTINVAMIQAGFGGIALPSTTFDLRDNTVVNGNFVSDTDNNNSIILNQTQINGNIGAQGKRFATLIMNPNKTANIDGDIFATNTIINQNGILNLAGNNSFFGTVNSAGALPATLTFEGNTAVNFDIGGTNPLSTVNFSGPLGSVATLNAFVYANAVNVNGGGTLLVMPSEFGFTLGGDLTISNGSTLHLQPSAVIETTNDFILTGAGNTLAVDLGGSRYVFGGVFADNQAVLDNNATIEILNPGFSPVRTDATALIVSGLPMAAVPQLVTNSLLTSVDAALINAGTRLELYIQSLPVHTYAKQSNTIGVATALDEIASGTSIYPIGPATGTLQNILDQLGIFTDEDSLNNALATLSPIVDGGIFFESFNNQNAIFGTVGDRMDRTNFWRIHALSQNNSGVSHGDNEDAQPGLWVKVFHQHGSQKYRNNIPGYKDHNWGITIGGDTMITHHSLIGGSLSWSALDVNHDISASKTNANSYQATIYSSVDFDCPLYVNAAVGVSYNNYITARNIAINNLALFPRGHFHGIQTGAKAEAGYIFGSYQYHVIPMASLFYSNLNVRSYQETNAGTASQIVNGQDLSTLLAGVGVKLVDDYPLSDYYLLQSEVHAMGFYDFINDRVQTTSQFTGAGPSFNTIGFKPVRDSYNVGASLTLFSHYHFNLSGEYDFNYKQDYRAHSGFFRVRYEYN